MLPLNRTVPVPDRDAACWQGLAVVLVEVCDDIGIHVKRIELLKKYSVW